MKKAVSLPLALALGVLLTFGPAQAAPAAKKAAAQENTSDAAKAKTGTRPAQGPAQARGLESACFTLLPTGTKRFKPEEVRTLNDRVVVALMTLLHPAGDKASQPGRKLSYDNKTFTLLVTDTPENLKRVKGYLDSLPEFKGLAAFHQEVIFLKFMPADRLAPKVQEVFAKTGIQATAPKPDALPMGLEIIPFGELNALIVRYQDPAQLRSVRQLVWELDKPVPQIQLEGMIIDLNKERLPQAMKDFSVTELTQSANFEADQERLRKAGILTVTRGPKITVLQGQEGGFRIEIQQPASPNPIDVVTVRFTPVCSSAGIILKNLTVESQDQGERRKIVTDMKVKPGQYCAIGGLKTDYRSRSYVFKARLVK